MTTDATHTPDDLPSIEEALAYGRGYTDGLRDAEKQDVASLIQERDLRLFDLATEKARRKIAERSKAELLEALRELIGLYDGNKSWSPEDHPVVVARAAIAKAEGAALEAAK